jgi:hypothetical protein
MHETIYILCLEDCLGSPKKGLEDALRALWWIFAYIFLWLPVVGRVITIQAVLLRIRRLHVEGFL